MKKEKLINISKLISRLLILSFFAIFITQNVFAENFALLYDNNGNLIEDGDFYYSYNSLNYLESVTEKDPEPNLILEFFYTPDGERYKKIAYQSDGKNETTYYIDKNLIKIVNDSGSFITTYYYDDQILVGEKLDNGEIRYYHPDHLGSTNLVTNSSGEVIEKTDYYPFGAVISGGSSRYLFTGKELDKESDLNYYGARYYSPTFRQFIQPDQVIKDLYRPQNLNRYSYVLNNPQKYIDPTGNYFESVLDIGSLAWSVHDIIKNPTDILNWAAAAADIACLALPLVTGGGTGIRALKAADKVKDLNNIKKISSLDKVAEKTSKFVDISKVPNHLRRNKQYESFKILENDKIRYYKKFVNAQKEGRTAGARFVNEVDSKTGKSIRTWYESYDKKGNVIRVHPKSPKDLGHLEIDTKTGKVTEKW